MNINCKILNMINDKWYNDSHLLTQLIIIPPIFFHGLYLSEVIPKQVKIIISVSFLVLVIAAAIILCCVIR